MPATEAITSAPKIFNRVLRLMGNRFEISVVVAAEENDYAESCIDEAIKEIAKGPILDACLILAAQKVEHYEIGTYGTLIALAEQLDFNEAIRPLTRTLEEEKKADVTLTKIAISEVNQKASQAA